MWEQSQNFHQAPPGLKHTSLEFSVVARCPSQDSISRVAHCQTEPALKIAGVFLSRTGIDPHRSLDQTCRAPRHRPWGRREVMRELSAHCFQFTYSSDQPAGPASTFLPTLILSPMSLVNRGGVGNLSGGRRRHAPVTGFPVRRPSATTAPGPKLRPDPATSRETPATGANRHRPA